MPYFLGKYDPDALRFYLTATAPETRDTEFSWEDFVEWNSNEPVATWGNLANRMLSFAYKRLDGAVPEPGDPSGASGQAWGRTLSSRDRRGRSTPRESTPARSRLIRSFF